MASRTRKKLGRDLIFPLGNWLDGCSLLLVHLKWVTGCPTLVPVNTSSEKGLLQEGEKVILIKDYEAHDFLKT